MKEIVIVLTLCGNAETVIHVDSNYFPSYAHISGNPTEKFISRVNEVLGDEFDNEYIVPLDPALDITCL